MPSTNTVGPVTVKAPKLVSSPPLVTATWPVPAVIPAPPVSVAFVPLTVTLRTAVTVLESSAPFIVISRPIVVPVVATVPAVMPVALPATKTSPAGEVASSVPLTKTVLPSTSKTPSVVR